MDVNLISSKKLAYLGDAVYELMVRSYLFNTNTNDLNKLHRLKVGYVSAKNQALALDYLLENNLVSLEEQSVIKRARNTKLSSKPRHTNVLTYKKSTALEALFGYLYLTSNTERIRKLAGIIFSMTS